MTSPRVLIPAILIVLAFWGLVWLNLDQPTELNFDEAHYIPAAKVFLNPVPLINLEHPPLGKAIISWGISLFGDTPIGWRFMSTVFGALTLAGMYFWAQLLFSSVRTSLFVAVLTIANNMLYVQSRIAMLDGFMTAFMIWGAFAFSYWWKERSAHLALLMSGVFFGLALGTKWFALIPMGIAGLLILYALWKHRCANSTLAVISFPCASILAYVLSYWPMARHQGYSWAQFFTWQYNIWDGQRRVPNVHPYLSQWWSWPLELRPIWYSFKQVEQSFQGVVLIGNPVILWGGFVAVLCCAWFAWKKRSRLSLEVALAYGVFFLGWAIVPRKAMFFYYYYPAVLVLSLALATAWEEGREFLGKYFELTRWGFAVLSLLCFIFFFPVLSSRSTLMSELGYWIWFQSWI